MNEHDDSGDVAGFAINAALPTVTGAAGDPIGAFVRFGSPSGDRLQVVGVVGNVSNEGRGMDTRPETYLLDALAPVRQMKFIVRSDLPLSSLLPELRHATETIAPHLPVFAVSTMAQLADDSTSLERFASVVVTFFALSALALACLGIYSMTAFSLGERRVEFGTRMALGAAPRDLMRLIIGDSARLAVYGVLAGIPAVAGATWILVHFMQLHHLGALPYAGSALVVSCLATAACLPPAWRATFLSPMVAIRQESEDFWTAGRRSIQVIAQVIKPGRNTQAASPNVFTGLIEATRRADSTTQVLAGVLQELRTQFACDWAMIFDRASGERATAPEASLPAWQRTLRTWPARPFQPMDICWDGSGSRPCLPLARMSLIPFCAGRRNSEIRVSPKSNTSNSSVPARPCPYGQKRDHRHSAVWKPCRTQGVQRRRKGFNENLRAAACPDARECETD